MSKKYKEELDKIVMDEEMKKRILHNVLNTNIESKSIIQTNCKNNIIKRNIQMTVACFTVVVCISIVKISPDLFKYDNSKFKENQVVENSDDEINILKNSEESKLYESNNDSDNTNDSTESSSTTNQIATNDENIKKNNSVNKESNGNLNINEDSSKIESKENSSDNSEMHYAESSNVDSAPSQINADTETKNEISLEGNLKDGSKSENETIVNNKLDDNLDNSSDLECNSFIIKEYKTLEEAEDAINLKINSIKVLPKGFDINNISVISDEIIEIEYSDGQDNITFRAGKDIDNISGEYNIYDFKNVIKLNNVNVNLEGNKNTAFNLAYWEKDNISYSISSINGINEEMMLNMIKSNF